MAQVATVPTNLETVCIGDLLDPPLGQMEQLSRDRDRDWGRVRDMVGRMDRDRERERGRVRDMDGRMDRDRD